MFHFSLRRGLSSDEKAFWDDNGYLILRGALRSREVDEMLHLVDEQWANRDGNDHVIDILDGEDSGKSYRLAEIDPRMRGQVYKLNSLFGRSQRARRICHSPRVKRALTELLDGEPLVCASLNFERGSQQPYHLDTWYMPPYVDDMMIAANFALEDVDDDNGPFMFYPGSHKIPAYRFSNGGLWMVNEEGPACDAYLQAELQSRGLQQKTFSGQRGDVLLWHAQLLHGGAPIRDPGRTRNSLVVHYWRKQDVPSTDPIRIDRSGAYLARSLRGEIIF